MSIAEFMFEHGITSDPDSLDAFHGGLARGHTDGAWQHAAARECRGVQRRRRAPQDLVDAGFAYTSYSQYGEDDEHAFYEEAKFRRKQERARKAAARAAAAAGAGYSKADRMYKDWILSFIDNGTIERWTHVRFTDMHVDWWYGSKKGTVFCQMTGFKSQAHSPRKMRRILDRIARKIE